MKDTQVILSLNFARRLLKKGFEIIDLEKSKKQDKQLVFIFRYSEELQKEMDAYFHEVERRKTEKISQETIK